MTLPEVSKIAPWFLSVLVIPTAMYFDIIVLKEEIRVNRLSDDKYHGANTERTMLLKIEQEKLKVICVKQETFSILKEKVVKLEERCIPRDVYYQDLIKGEK